MKSRVTLILVALLVIASLVTIQYLQQSTMTPDLTESTIDTLWTQEPKILLNKHSPAGWWLKGYMNNEVSDRSWRDTANRLTNALEENNSFVERYYCQIYVNDFNNTIFVVTTSLETNVTTGFLEIMKPPTNVQVIFRKGSAPWIILEEWTDVLAHEIDTLESRGVQLSSFGVSENGTIRVSVVNLNQEKVENILEVLEDKVPMGILVLELGERASPIPPGPNSHPEIITVGVITPAIIETPKYEYLATLASNRLSQILTNENISASFEFITECSDGHAAITLELVQSFRSMDVNLLLIPGPSVYIAVVSPYVNDNDMLVISSSSSNHDESLLQNDNIFRLQPNDLMNSKVASTIADKMGIRAMIILELDDEWATSLGDTFLEEYEGEVVSRITYNARATDFSEYLALAETQAKLALSSYDYNEVGVFWIDYSDSRDQLSELVMYPLLGNLTWFAADPILDSDIEVDPVLAQRIQFITETPALVWSNQTMEIADMYEEMFGEGLNFEHAAFYDSCMLVGLSVLQAQTVHPLDLLDVIPMVGEGCLGLTGYCLLDGYGDRLSYQADIVAITDEELVWRKIGEYYSPEGIVVLSK